MTNPTTHLAPCLTRLIAALALLTALTLHAPTFAGAANLPDGRVYEMVTPAENQSADVYAPFAITANRLNPGEGDLVTRLPFQAATDGNAVTYVGDPTLGGTGSSGSGLGNEYLATRNPAGGWRKENGETSQVNLQTPADKGLYYQAFSSDLSTGILQDGSFEEATPFVLSSTAPNEGYLDLYTHATAEGNSGAYYPLITVRPPNRSPEDFGTFNANKVVSAVKGTVVFAGSAGGESLYEANDTLAPGAVDGGVEEENLYVSVGGVSSLVNVLPGGGSEANATFGSPAMGLPGNLPDFSHVISADGSRVFWTDLNTHVLYMDEGVGAPGERTVEVDASQGPGTGGGGRFWTASSDGSKVFFTDESRLTGDSTAMPAAPDLYEYQVGSGHLVDLSVDHNAGQSSNVQGVIGASEDGLYVYFVAQGVLADNEDSEHKTAVAGEDNLYVLREGEAPRFIATLSPEREGEVSDGSFAIPGLDRQNPRAEFGDWQGGLGKRTAEVTPDGRNLVFMSDYQDVEGISPEVNGVKLEEVYTYSFEENRVFCASCSRDGTAPETNILAEEGGGAFLPPSWSNVYIPQWISEDGSRVLFDSLQPLVPQDTNGKPDVYEWERDGTGTCQESRGCVSLLSEGSNSSASWLAAESASGDDAFIITRSELVPEDEYETYNLFDARVDGYTPPAPPACTGTGCQGVPAPPPTFATPASVTFAGEGNFSPSAGPAAPVKTAKQKPPTRAQRLAKALRACARDRAKARRAGCERTAHKRYGPPQRRKRS